MINVTYKKRGLKIEAVWFCDNTDIFLNNNQNDVIFLHGVKADTFQKAVINKQFSLTTDLMLSAEEIFKQFNKNYRYEINRAQKENVECISYNSTDLKSKPALLKSFKREYEEFVKLKGITNTYNDAAMEKYIESGNVILTKAFKNEENYAQHVYLYDDNNARLLYSVSNFRTEGLGSKEIGRANKYLHWYDIQYLQNYKIETLDWGGVSSLENPNGVDKFKKEFGGLEKSYYNAILGKSLIGKIVVYLMRMNRG